MYFVLITKQKQKQKQNQKHQVCVISLLYNRGSPCPLHEHNPVPDLREMRESGMNYPEKKFKRSEK